LRGNVVGKKKKLILRIGIIKTEKGEKEGGQGRKYVIFRDKSGKLDICEALKDPFKDRCERLVDKGQWNYQPVATQQECGENI